jgi:acyl-CoA:acyl-CoA alkyltransferase
MYLSGVACTLPTQQISNDEILELVSYYSRREYDGNLDALLLTINAKLRRIGIATRYWRAPKERPIELLRRACEAALQQANVVHREVDFVIYVGVDRGFAEPANACFIAKELGMNRARTFDIADACLGWCTATEIAQALFVSAPSAVALVVSAEFPMRLGGAVLPGCFTIGSKAELEWKFPALTLGEAATASVLVGGGANWQYVHESHNQFADLCTVGLGASADYAGKSKRVES